MKHVISNLIFIQLLTFLVFQLPAQTHVSGSLNTNTVWGLAGSPYIVDDDVTVEAGVTLTIQPGVIVKFNDWWDDIHVNGTLNAVGTTNAMIFFTSNHDDAHGGDTNNNGGTTSPGPDQWSGIQVANTGSADLDYCWFGYGGGQGRGLLSVFSDNVDVSNCTFFRSAENGIFLDHTAISIRQSRFESNPNGIGFNDLSDNNTLNLVNNVFVNNNRSVSGVLTEMNQNINLSGNSGSGLGPAGSALNGFVVSGTVLGNVIFSGQNNFPFIIVDDLDILETAALRFSAGTVVKFNDWWDDIHVYGTLTAIGSSTAPVVFTSLFDDTRGGDTNGDGNATLPAGDNWSSVYIEEMGSGTFDYCFFGYGGGQHAALLETHSSNIEVSNSEFAFSAENGIYSVGSSYTVRSSNFHNNSSSGITYSNFDNNKDFTLVNNVFTDNTWAVNGTLTDNSTNLTLTGNSSSGTNTNGVGYNGFGLKGTLEGMVNYEGQDDFPFIVVDDLNVKLAASLTITPGTVMKFLDWWDDIDVYGNLFARGTMSAPIVFTSLHDDTFGGDTNGNGGDTEPAPGQWSSMYVEEGASATFEHCYFGYGGGQHYGMIHTLSSNITIDQCEFTRSGTEGIYAINATFPVTACSIHDNNASGIFFSNLDPGKNLVLTNNIFSNNSWAVYSVFNEISSNIILSGNTSSGGLSNGFGRNGFGFKGTVKGSVIFDGQDNFPFIVDDDLDVMAGADLSFSAGTVIKFNDWWDDIVVNGSLTAQGTEDKKIIFTSVFDDTYAGDTNNDGASQGVPGHWSSIYLEAQGNGLFDYCHIGYGGGQHAGAIHALSSQFTVDHSTFLSNEQNGIYCKDASPEVRRSTFIDNTSHGIYFSGFDPGVDVILSENTFQNQGWAVNSDFTSMNSNIFLTGNSSTGTNANALGRNGFGLAGFVVGQVVFQGQDDFPFIVKADLSVGEGAALELTKGTVVKFDGWWADLHVYGSFKAIGTKDAPIIFTSLFDDKFGGDTNGDLDATAPAAENWSSLHFGNTSFDSRIEYACINFGGGQNSGNLVINSNNVSVENCAVGNAAGNGIVITDASPTITRTVIHDSHTGMRIDGNSQPVLFSNDIISNYEWGMFNSNGGNIVNATSNYWGSSSGPLHALSNPDGTGNKVNDFVDCSNWLTSLSDQDLVPKPAFYMRHSGQDFSFHNTSVFESDFMWTFGDGDTSYLNSPYHHYAIPGKYDVCLTGTTQCYVEMTECHTAEVKGVQAISPSQGGNIGDVTIEVFGVGFTPTSYFTLTLGGHVLTGTDYVLTASGSLIATFDLAGQTLGQYDLNVVVPGDETFTVTNAFTVVQGTVAQPWVTIGGRPNALLGTWTKFNVKYGNDGNTDAKSIPITIAVTDLPGLEIEFPEIQIDFPPFVDPNDPLIPLITSDPCYYIVQSVQGIEQSMRVYTYHIPLIQASSVNTIDIRIKSQESYQFIAWTGTSFYPGGFNTHYVDCFVEIVREMGYSQTIIDLLTVDRFVTEVEYITRYFYDELHILGCWNWYWAWAISQVVEDQLTYVEIVDIVQRFTEIYVDAYAYESIYIDCIEIIIPHDYEDHPVNVVTSFDPNEKVGITGIGDENYINKRENITYTVFFENKAEATAPAHTVIIRDTLDPDVFDLTYFSFEDIYVGDKFVSPIPRTTSYVTELPIPELNVNARIEADVDMASGSIEWLFRSFDPATGEEVEDPFVGILPPNVTSPEGEGSVRFTVGLKQPISDGDVVANDAIIYFDANEPIITNTFINTFDLSPPESHIGMLQSWNYDEFELDLYGSDAGSGIEFHEIWVSKDNDPYRLWKISSGPTEQYQADGYGDYRFYSVAVDKVGNKELVPAQPDAQTLVSSSDDLFEEERITLYPNPVNDLLYCRFAVDTWSEATISVYDLFGRRLEYFRMQNHAQGDNTFIVNMKDYPPGIYSLSIDLPESRVVKKFMKE